MSSAGYRAPAMTNVATARSLGSAETIDIWDHGGRRLCHLPEVVLAAAELRWPGYRKVWRLLGKRLSRRLVDFVAQQLLSEVAAMVSARGDDADTLGMAWRFDVQGDWPALGCTVIATDAEETIIERAKAACYDAGSLKDLPQVWIGRPSPDRARCASRPNFTKTSTSHCKTSASRCLMACSI